MKVSNLMIGDLVQFDEDICIIEELRVDGTVVLVAMNTDLTSVDGDQVDVDELSPIPIAHDILAKNGFHRSPRWHYCEITTDDGFKIYVQLGCGGTIDYVRITKHNSDLKERDLDATVSIHYVHELQHLLRLVGITKEIRL